MKDAPARILSPLGEAAVEYARRGWRVFPLQPGAKVPLAGTKGHLDATSDPAKVAEIWMRHPDANIGVNLAASGLVALDVDSYKADCEFSKFFAGVGMPATLEQRSASGGRHYIFKAESGDSFPGSPCKGVDIKHKGYIVLEPSNFDGARYRFETDDAPAPVPEWFPRKETRAAPAHNVVQHPSSLFGKGLDLGPRYGGEDDTDERVLRVLATAPNTLGREEWVKLGHAVKGELGDRGRDAFLAFSARYPGSNPKEDARVWDTLKPDGSAGAGTVFELLGSDGRDARLVPLGAPVSTAEAQPLPQLFAPASALHGKTVKPRDFLVEGYVPNSTVTLLNGDGGTGKSLIAMQLAVSVALGRAWMGRPTKEGPVLFLSAEDDIDELHRRLSDVTRAEGVSLADLDDLHWTCPVFMPPQVLV